MTISEDGSAKKLYQVILSTAEPAVSLSLSQSGSKIRLTGVLINGSQTTEHGFIYITKARLGARSFTVNSSGRTKVKIGGINEDGSYRYSMTPKNSSTKYVIRAYAAYLNEKGKRIFLFLGLARKQELRKAESVNFPLGILLFIQILIRKSLPFCGTACQTEQKPLPPISMGKRILRIISRIS